MSTGTWGSKLVIIAVVLVIIGALNWGFVGLFNNNIVNSLNMATFNIQWLERLIYILVGVSAVYLIYVHFSGNNMMKY